MYKPKSHKEYRFEQNPKEKEFHDKYLENFYDENNTEDINDGAIFGWANDFQSIPNDYLSEREHDIILTHTQWLGSPLGQGFLRTCGFIPKNRHDVLMKQKASELAYKDELLSKIPNWIKWICKWL